MKLQAVGLVKQYRKIQIVGDVSVAVSSGQIVGLLGPNGAGKTTFFHMVAGLVAPNRGKLLLDGEDITALPMHRRARRGLSYLPQEPSIFRRLSVRDNLAAVLETRRGLSRAKRRERVRELLYEFGLESLAGSSAGVLSGGERRRLEIARAVALSPSFLLLDEPFAGVDPIVVAGIKQLVREQCEKGIGVLLTDHNVRETLDLCDYTYVMNDGRVLAEGRVEEVITDERVRQIYLGESF